MLIARLAEAAAYLFPVACAGCGVEGRALCRACAAGLTPRVRPVSGLPGATAALDYDGITRTVLLGFKEQGRVGLATPLAVPFAAAVSVALGARDAVVAPVPSTRAARRRRGFEPVRVLASRAGIRVAPLFRPARPHAVQKGLGVADRARNLAEVFELARAVDGLRVLLIDDVITTGATLGAAARVLREGGAEVVGAAVLAATPRRDGRSSGTLSNSL